MKALAIIGVLSLFAVSACGDDDSDGGNVPEEDSGTSKPTPTDSEAGAGGSGPGGNNTAVELACEAVVDAACGRLADCGFGLSSKMCLGENACVGLLTGECTKELTPAQADVDAAKECAELLDAASCDETCTFALPEECEVFAAAFPIPEAPPAQPEDAGSSAPDAGNMMSDAGNMMSDAGSSNDAGTIARESGAGPVDDGGTAEGDAAAPTTDGGAAPQSGLGCYDVCLP